MAYTERKAVVGESLLEMFLLTYYGFIISSVAYISGQTGLGLKEMVL
jgi:hypothetical protein